MYPLIRVDCNCLAVLVELYLTGGCRRSSQCACRREKVRAPHLTFSRLPDKGVIDELQHNVRRALGDLEQRSMLLQCMVTKLYIQSLHTVTYDKTSCK